MPPGLRLAKKSDGSRRFAPKIALETARKNVAVVVDLNEVILALGTRDLLGFHLVRHGPVPFMSCAPRLNGLERDRPRRTTRATSPAGLLARGR